MGCITPLPDPLGTGIPQCPTGYHFDPVQGLCCPDISPPVNMQDPTIRSLVTGLADREFDPAQYAKAAAQGLKDSGMFESWVVALLRAAIRLLAPLIEEAASLLDDVLTVLAEVFQAAQGQNSTGYYRLAGAMITDLTGVEADGDQLARDFQGGGRQAAMRGLGGSIFNTLASEFANETQATVGGVFQTPAGSGLAGLPGVTLSPEQGIAGAKAFLGYAAGFAIREGNTDMLAAYLPHGIGEMFKDFAEDFAKNLGIGRMARLVWKPLVSTLVATPAQQAMNIQYRPTLLDVAQAYRAWITGDFSPDDLARELSLHGLSQARGAALQWQHAKPLDPKSARVLNATGQMDDNNFQIWMRRTGHTDEVSALMQQADDMTPARDACLAAARHFAGQYLVGRITRIQYAGALDSIKNNMNGAPLLTAGEVQNLNLIPEIGSAAIRRHLSVAQLQREYIDGLMTLGEFSQAVSDLGYGADDVQLLEQELLISAKRASDRAAKATATALRGKYAKLTVAQMKTSYENGIMDLAEVRQELTVRNYAPSAIDAIAEEFRIAAKLQTGTPPTA